MQTLRRELRMKFTEVLTEADVLDVDNCGWLIDKLADAALSVSGIAKRTDEERPAYVINTSNIPENFSLEWQIAAGQTPKQEEIDQNQLIQEALNTFESDMQLPGNWQWYAVKPAEEKIWKALREFIVKKYVENPKAFAEYQTWRTQPFASGKMSNRAIKNAPQDFEASWSDFLASNAMYGKKTKSSMFETLT